MFQVEAYGVKTRAILHRTPHLSTRREILRIVGDDDVRIERMTALFTVSIPIV
jgi:hypothetical protein